jgi:hypothetical protein
MGLIDLSFRAIGMDTLREYWPVFVAGAVVEVWVMRRIRRWGRFPFQWVVLTAMVPVLLSAVLWGESYLARQSILATIGETGISPWEELGWHLERSQPLLAPLAIVLLGLVKRPRSEALVSALVSAAGALASWIVAMWLYTTDHEPAVVRLLILPGVLGMVAALVGFPAATAVWMAIGRWVWREGRRRKGPPGGRSGRRFRDRRDVLAAAPGGNPLLPAAGSDVSLE